MENKPSWATRLRELPKQYPGLRMDMVVLQALESFIDSEIQKAREEAYKQASESAGIHFIYEEIPKAIRVVLESLREEIPLLRGHKEATSVEIKEVIDLINSKLKT